MSVDYGTLVVGAGPGGIGPLAWAARHAELARWCRRGLLLVDGHDEIGTVELGRYRVRADSSAASFVEGLEGPLLSPVRAGRSARALDQLGAAHPPLSLASELLGQLGRQVATSLPALGGQLASRTRLRSLRLRKDGAIEALLHTRGLERRVSARAVVLALGGRARRGIERGLPACLTDVPLVGSDELLRAEDDEVRALVRGAPRVVIVGGSHSAFSSAWRLLTLDDTVEITIAHRSALRVTYASSEHAVADAYTGFSRDDVCPATGRVHRLGGLRGDGRELYLRIARGDEPRVRLSPLHALEAMPQLVVAATGYAARTVPLLDENGRRIRLRAEDGGAAADGSCRLARADGSAAGPLFVIGMASGYLPSEAGDGEQSFRGATNGVWLYRHATGARVFAGVATALGL